MNNSIPKWILLSSITWLTAFPLAAATVVTNWVAYNDHDSGAGTAANVTTYSLTQAGNVGQPAGGPMTDFNTGGSVGVNLQVTSVGFINGTTGSSGTPNPGTPADQIFGGKIAWLDSALYFGPSPYTAEVRLTFTNLTAGARYHFRGTMVRGNNYAGRWSLVTLSGASTATPAHILGSPSPGIVTNGWSPYGDNLAPIFQAAFNSGENRGGDVIGWDDIVPVGTSFSVIVSNYQSVSTVVPGGTIANTYCYALDAIELTELVELGPVEITQQPVATTNVEEYAAWSLNVRASGALASYQWYKGDFESGTPITGATASTYSVPSARLSDAGDYFVIVTNSTSSATSTVAQVTIFVNSIVITQQPTNHVTALELRPFDLSVTVTGTHPQYQWYKDNAPLADATNRTYSVASASVNDVGNYFVIITNSLHAATSSVTQVTYSSDAQAPVVQRVVGSGSGIQVTIEFDEALAPLVAADTGYYSFTPFLDIYTAELTNASTVVLTTAPQDPATTYSLTINALDLVGNYGGTNVDFHPWVPNKSGVSFEVYATGNAGTAVSNLTAFAGFPDSPSEAYVLTNFDTTSIWPDTAPANTAANRQNYGGRLRGLFIPTSSGNWRFFIRSDDASELWMNTNGVAASGKKRIAFEPACCNAFQEPGTANQTSLPYALVAGQAYYLEALYKEGGGGDFCMVAARREGDPTAATNLPPINFSMGYPNLPAGVAGVASIIQQPAASTSVEAPGSITLSVLGSNSLNAPFTYQWQQSDGVGGFTNLSNANLKSLSRSGLIVADSTQFRCIVASGDSSATSTVASVTVTPDATGPTLISAKRGLNQTSILVTFGEPVLGADVAGNFHVCETLNPANCLNILSAVPTNGSTQVWLDTDVPAAGVVYQLSASGITDLNANALRAPTSVVVRVQVMILPGTNGPITFDTLPGLEDGWSTLPMAGGTGTLTTQTQMNTDVNTRDASNAVALVTATANPPGATGNGGYDPVLRSLYTRPTGVNAASLMATLLNAAGDLNSLAISFDLGNPIPAVEEIPPYSVYYSFTGATGTWTFIPALSGSTLGTRTVTLDFPSTWMQGAKLYLLWADDNASPSPDAQFTVDNFAVNTAPPLTPVQIVGQPAATQTINEGQSANFTVSATGTRAEFQWYKDNVMLPGATNATYSITSVVETNAGRYFCIVSNQAPSIAQSSDALLAVLPDTNAPVLVSAVGTTNANIITLTFSERLDATLAGDVSHYTVTPTFGGSALAIQSAVLSSNGMTVTLTTDARTPFAYYTLTVQNLTDAAYRHNVQNPNPIKVFLGSQVNLIAPSSTWRYHELGVDLGTGWTAGNYVDDEAAGWSNGVALFVGKNGTPGNGDIPILTTLAMTNNAPGYYTNTITYYFRQHFTMPAAAQLAGLQSYQLQVRPILDDGAVFHINGQAARYVRMTNQPVVYTSYAQAPAQGNDYRFEGPYNLPTTNVTFGGDNVMAVEVHQINATSSDVAFAAEVLITVPPLEMRLTSPPPTPGNFTINWPAVPGFHLYEADKVEGPYTPVAGDPSGTYSVSTSLAKGKFYQVRSP